MKRRHIRLGYARAAKWKRPSEAELFRHGKPLAIYRHGDKWAVSYLGHPVVNVGGGVGTKKLAVWSRPDYVEGSPTAELTRDEAEHVAHMIGRYMLGLSDLVFSYTKGMEDE